MAALGAGVVGMLMYGVAHYAGNVRRFLRRGQFEPFIYQCFLHNLKVEELVIFVRDLRFAVVSELGMVRPHCLHNICSLVLEDMGDSCRNHLLDECITCCGRSFLSFWWQYFCLPVMIGAAIVRVASPIKT